jgi:hypothetical protein
MSNVFLDSQSMQLALASVGLVIAALRHAMFERRRQLQSAVARRSLMNRQQFSDDAPVQRIGHSAGRSLPSQGVDHVPERRPSAWERPAGNEDVAEPQEDDLTYLDAVDRASALSFPASDPPAYSGTT